MFILPMAAFGDDQVPTVSLNEFDGVTDFHNGDSSIVCFLFELSGRSFPSLQMNSSELFFPAKQPNDERHHPQGEAEWSICPSQASRSPANIPPRRKTAVPAPEAVRLPALARHPQRELCWRIGKLSFQIQSGSRFLDFRFIEDHNGRACTL
jgi:hypothetical protein